MLLNTAVKEVGDGVITLQDRAGGEPYCLPFGVCVWAAGVKPNDLVQQIMEKLPEGSQTNFRALTTDKMLRVKGSGGSIYAFGDCSTIERPNSLACAERLYGDRDRTIDLKEFERVLTEGSKEFPHLEELRQTPTKFTYAHKGSLAYIGADAAVLDIPGMGVIRGLAAGFIWKSFETFSQFSIRNQILVLSDLA